MYNFCIHTEIWIVPKLGEQYPIRPIERDDAKHSSWKKDQSVYRILQSAGGEKNVSLVIVCFF
jgi:hypothetical protein